PLYERLEKAGRLDRPKHWLEFAPFVMAHAPLRMTIEEAKAETRSAWERSYSPERNASAVEAIADHDIQYRIGMLVARLFFRGIYFPQMTRRAWLKLIYDNRRTILPLAREGFAKWRASRRRASEAAEVAPAS
ncbi:MAG TPA: hypothetical protein VE642_06415, partial [Pyrinomonadaceae bacterium]|nr:hypothetical protein [Pyrinomonadaceae bacterium]